MSVCKDCPDRHYNCHSECEKYQAQRKVYKPPADETFRQYWGERNTKIERKKFQQRKK